MIHIFELPQYRMVLVNLITLTTFVIGLALYRFVFPKKKINFFILLLILSMLPLISILRPGPYESGDFSIHTQIAMSFDQSLREGNILPRWNDNSCGRFGCPDFIFLFILPYYVISMIHLFAPSFIDSLKLFLIISFIGSGITMYLWLKESFKSELAFIGSLFYLYAPYHLLNLHFRTDIGELLSFVIFPTLFLFAKRLADTSKLVHSLLFAISATLLLLSHTTMFYIAIPLVSVYFVILWWQKLRKNISQLFQLLISLLFTFLLSIFYWLPLIYQSKFIHYGLTSHITLHSIWEVLYSPWRLGFLFQGHYGELSYLIGYPQLLIILLSVYIFMRIRRKNRLQYGFFLFTTFILIFLMLDISRLIWKTVPFMDKFEDSHRLLLPINFFISTMASFTSKKIKKGYIINALCFIAIAATILNWGNRRTLPNVTDIQLRNADRIDANGHHNIAPIWVDISAQWSLRRSDYPLQSIKGQIKVDEIKRTTNIHRYSVITKSTALVRENTYYFPGWKVFINNKETKINYANAFFPGLIVFEIPPGKNQVNIIFEDNIIQRISNLISLFTADFIVLYFTILFIKKFKSSFSKMT